MSSTLPPSSAETMKALEFFRKTGEIKVVQVPKPTLPNKNTTAQQPNLLVKVVAAAIDQGLAIEFPKLEVPTGYALHSTASPLYLGWHYSGVVEQTAGDDCDGVTVGTAVFGFLAYSSSQQQGSYAEYILVNSKECGIKPESVSFEVAAAAGTESITALQALRDEAQLTAGKSVLICGASGGVGSAAVCIAKLLGAKKVTAVCSDGEVKRVQESFQPHAIVNRTTCVGDPIKSCGEKFDIIFDCPGAFPGYKYFDCLNPKGTYVVAAPNFGFLLGALYSTLTWSSKRFRMVLCKPTGEDFALVADWLAQGTLKIAIDSTFHVADMHAAIAKQASAGKKGRVVIKVQDGWDKEREDNARGEK